MASVTARALCLLAAALACLAWGLVSPDESLGFPACSALENARASFWVGVVLARGLLWPADWWLHVPENHIFDSLRAKYGRACTLRVMGRPLVVVLDPKDVAQVLRDSPDPLRAGELKTRFFRGLMDGNVGTAHGSAWARRRELTERCMPPRALLHRAASSVVEALSSRPSSYAEFRRDVAVPVATRLVTGGTVSLEPMFEALAQTTENWWRFLLLRQNTLTDAQSERLTDHLRELYRRSSPESMVGTLRGLPGGDQALTEIPHWVFPIVGAVGFAAYATLQYADVDLGRCRSDRGYLTACVVRTMWRNNPVFTMVRTVGVPEYAVAGGRVHQGTQIGVLVSGWLRTGGSGADVFSKGAQRCPGKDTAVVLATEICEQLLRRFPAWPHGTVTSTERLAPDSV